ncbi:MAG TPA: S-formylglutathione hydrolase [Ramlibacter sp.]|jgi:S-formylglutathione hydrolase|uniref:S-formylglutathione hydrolase n=1 Tax=Ramlibacter sp. TaxID=1917967 RepID=UPI002D52D7D7|nr:S-formylglutathione hydrolase [Ramlibacter sp.]HZY18372.1 S-formylglutathione hydrolase [Ramlibacter sp.]
MAAFTTLEEHRCFGGVQSFHEHPSATVGLPMRFGVYRPAQALAGRRVPVLFYLAGLTCNEQTFAIKAGAQRLAAERGWLLVTPDTSPRATGVEGAEADWDFGTGAGFYLDATQPPWSTRWRMESWITGELRELVMAGFGGLPERTGIFGHSMGGHGALTLALRHPGLFRSASAFAPICAPSEVPWGHKAFSGYLGADRQAWAEHDACALIESGRRAPPLLVDQGLADSFLATQLRPDRLIQACESTGQPLTLRRHEGYDHGYFFVASFVADHFAHHAAALGAG